MNASSILIGCIVLGIVLGKFYFALIIKQGKAHVAEETQRERIALRSNPSYAQMEERDRAYEITLRRLAIQEQDATHRRYLERTRVLPETYMVYEEPTTITSFPSLKRVQDWRVEAELPSDSPELPPSCHFSDVLRSFTPTMQQIFLAYRPGYQMVLSPVVDLCHVANVASTGAGKSVNIRMIVGQLCSVGVRVLIFNPHFTRYDIVTHEDWTPIENKLFKPPVTDYRVIAQWLKWAASVELRRCIACYNRSQPWGSPLFLVVEELPSITQHVEGAMDWIAEILREGRKVGLFVITAAQDMLVKTLNLEGGAIRDCFRTAFYMGGDVTTARKLLDLQGTIDDSGLGKGVALLRSSELPKGTRVRVPYADNESLYRLLGPSTFDFSKIVDADPDTEQGPVTDDLPRELGANNVMVFPVAKEQRKVATLEEAIEAWNAGHNTVDKLMAALEIKHGQAYKLYLDIQKLANNS